MKRTINNIGKLFKTKQNNVTENIITVTPKINTVTPNGMTAEQWYNRMHTNKLCPEFHEWCKNFGVSRNYTKHENCYSGIIKI